MTPIDLCTGARALLFDLDGTLVDSMPAHCRAWSAVLSRYGCLITDDVIHSLAGVPNQRTVEILNERFGWNLNPLQIAHEKDEAAHELLITVPTIPSVMEIIHRFHERVPFGVVSGSTRALVSRILETSSLDHYFSTVIAFEDSARGKPHPDPFLEAARQLQVNPRDCIVFEDGDAGIQSAQAASMRVIRVLTSGELQPI